MKTFTDQQLITLKNLLVENAQELFINGKVKQVPYYPGDGLMKDYQWIIINLHHLKIGEVEMYFTGLSSILKIDSVQIDPDKVNELGFKQIEKIFRELLKDKKVEELGNILDKLNQKG